MAKKKQKRRSSKRTQTKRQESFMPVKPVRRQKDRGAVIKVVGVGGGGGNAVTRMMEGDRMRGVEFIAVNTDAQDLNHALAHQKIYIGRALTHGLGAGMNPEIGKQAAEENRSEIGEVLQGADIVFLTAGMGGGTGTGAIPIIAEIAKEKGVLTIAVVTKPFTFEGSQRMTIAQDGLARLKEKVDALVVIPNDRVFAIIDKETPILRAFGFIDEILKNAVKAISDLINVPGIVNVDFADIAATLRDSGTTLIGIGIAGGPERGVKAVAAALNSPLLEISIDSARGVLFSVAGGRDIRMAEIHDIAKAISANLDPNARVIFGASYDRSLKDKSIKVTVIATGFSGVFAQRLPEPSLFSVPEVTDRAVETPGAGKLKAGALKERPPKATEVESEAWEIPAFLRKKKGR